MPSRSCAPSAYRLVALITTVVLLGSSLASDAAAASRTTVIRIGALLSLTGSGSSLGATTKAALAVGIEHWNHELAHRHIRVALDVVDTGLSPARAAAGFAQVARRGARVVIGPQSNSEIAAIREDADNRGVLVVSQGSATSSLAIPNDNVFRFVPTDRVEGGAIADLMRHDGINVIVPVGRDDDGNRGLLSSVRAAAETLGIAVEADTTYPAGTTEFASLVGQVGVRLSAATEAKDPSTVGVYVAGSEEVAGVLAAERTAGGFDRVRWYGSDGAAQAKPLITNAEAAAFAVAHGGVPSPRVALPEGQQAKDQSIIARVQRRAHTKPDAFALAGYDAFNVAVRALLDVGAKAKPRARRAAFVKQANGYRGTTGVIRLDDAGDRVSSPYAFWSICADDNMRRWEHTATWTPPESQDEAGELTTGTCESPMP